MAKTTKSKTTQAARLKAENDRLKNENTRLKRELKTTPSRGRRIAHFFRVFGVMFFTIAAAVLLTFGNIIFWTANTAIKQDRFVAATSPVIKNTEVQQSVALYTTNSLFENVDVQSYVSEVLPPRADFLAPQLTSQLKSGTQKTLEKALASPKLQDTWNTVIAKQHERFFSFVANYEGNGTITLNDMYNQLSQSLEGTSLAFLANKQLPAKVGDVQVADASWLPTLHTIVTKIDTWRLLALLLCAVFLGLAIWLSHRRRRTLYWFSATTAVLMFATLIAIRVVREVVVGNVNSQYAEGVSSAYTIVLHNLVLQTALIMTLALVAILITWLTSRAPRAVAVKRAVADLFGGKLHTKLLSSPRVRGVTTWVGRHKRVLQVVAVLFVALLMLLTTLTISALLWYLVLLAFLLIMIEFIGGKTEVKTLR